MTNRMIAVSQAREMNDSPARPTAAVGLASLTRRPVMSWSHQLADQSTTPRIHPFRGPPMSSTNGRHRTATMSPIPDAIAVTGRGVDDVGAGAAVVIGRPSDT